VASLFERFFNRYFAGHHTPPPVMPEADPFADDTAVAPHTAPLFRFEEFQKISQETAVPPVTTPAPARAALPPAPFQHWYPRAPVDPLFYEWLLGFPPARQAHPQEQELTNTLYELLNADPEQQTLVPRMPGIIPPLLSTLRQEQASVSQLTKLIMRDPALVGEVLLAVNNVVHHHVQKITSLDAAVLMLGEEGLRYVIAKVAFRPILNLQQGPYSRRAAPVIWAQSEKCGLACHALSSHDDDTAPFHAFLAGLLHQIGLITVFRVLDQEVRDTSVPFSLSFCLLLQVVANTLSTRIATDWGLPEDVITALREQIPGSDQSTVSTLGILLHNADLISKMRMLINQQLLRSQETILLHGLSAQEAYCYRHLDHLKLFDLNLSEPASHDTGAT
jgi:HD-like signal output (HDOD) protein